MKKELFFSCCKILNCICILVLFLKTFLFVSIKDMLKYTFLEIKKTNYRDQSFNYKWFSYMKKKYELR